MRLFSRFIFIIILFYSINVFADDNMAVMMLEVNNIETSKGNIMIHLCRNQQEFNGEINPQYSFFFPAKKTSVTAKITLPKGMYAVKVFHDENENKMLDLNQADHPIEKFGFSNNFFGSYSAMPPFDKVLINIDKDENFVKVNLR